jgi:hypothetical protein
MAKFNGAMKTDETRLQYLQRVAKHCRTHYTDKRIFQRCHSSHTATEVMEQARKLFTDLNDHGVEGFVECGGVTYFNMGDSYALTVCFRSKNQRFQVTSWGDIVEREDNR